VLAASLHAATTRVVQPGAAGPNRLDVDLALLSAASPDLHDLRLVDSSGREIPYLLYAPKSSDAMWTSGTVLPRVTSKTSSGFEIDLGRAVDVDALRFEGVAAPFLKHVTIEGSGDRSRWSVLADATVFDLPAEELRRREVEFAPGTFRYLRITWDDRSSARVVGGYVRARLHGSAMPPAAMRAEVPFRDQNSERGRSRYRISLPGRGLPIDAVELRVVKGDIFRPATVSEPRLSGLEITPVTLGTATLRQTERDGVVASQLVIPISRPQSRELELAIDDGSNGRLSIDAVLVRLAPQPWILFEAPGTSPVVARFGDHSLPPPAYDLEAARELLSKTATRARWLDNGRVAAPATISAPPRFEGAPLDRSRFRFTRRVANAPAGLTLLPLDADTLARSNSLRDVRLVNESGRQVPYVLERRAAPVVVKLALGLRRADERNASVYEVGMRFPTVPDGAKLVVSTSSRVFTRRVELWHSEPEELLEAVTWQGTDADEAAPTATFDLPRKAGALQIRIDEGDNAPLPVTGAELHLPAFALRFFSPGTPLRLLYGNAAANAPRYDLALMAPRLFSEPAREVALTSPPAVVADESRGERRLFWIVIAAVAVMLLALVVRLLAPLLSEESRPLS
jgi:hypothetical protein